MVNNINIDTMEKKRTREQLIEDTFRCMWRRGDLKLTTVSIRLVSGGVVEKTFYKVTPGISRMKT